MTKGIYRKKRLKVFPENTAEPIQICLKKTDGCSFKLFSHDLKYRSFFCIAREKQLDFYIAFVLLGHLSFFFIFFEKSFDFLTIRRNISMTITHEGQDPMAYGKNLYTLFEFGTDKICVLSGICGNGRPEIVSFVQKNSGG